MKDKINKLLENLHRIYEDPEDPQYANIPKQIIHNNILFVFGSCFGVAVQGRFMIEFVEDDGRWFVSDSTDCNSSWASDKADIYKRVDDYLIKYGEPYCYSDTNTICGYELKPTK